jgi:hypothetical protein
MTRSPSPCRFERSAGVEPPEVQQLLPFALVNADRHHATDARATIVSPSFSRDHPDEDPKVLI